MNTKKVQELIVKIEQAEARYCEDEKQLSVLNKQLEMQAAVIINLKKELAEELRDLLSPSKSKAANPREHKGERQKGLTAAILAVFDDKAQHNAADVAETIERQGLTGANVAVSLSGLAKRGVLIRVERGTYVKAQAADEK